MEFCIMTHKSMHELSQRKDEKGNHLVKLKKIDGTYYNTLDDMIILATTNDEIAEFIKWRSLNLTKNQKNSLF